MTPSDQLAKEARYDVRVAVTGIAVLAVLMLVLPKGWFWFYFTPMAAFWFRYLWVRNKRDEKLLQAELLASGGRGAPGCYRSEAGICLTDGTHHLLIARDNVKPSLQLPDIVRRQ